MRSPLPHRPRIVGDRFTRINFYFKRAFPWRGGWRHCGLAGNTFFCQLAIPLPCRYGPLSSRVRGATSTSPAARWTDISAIIVSKVRKLRLHRLDRKGAGCVRWRRTRQKTPLRGRAGYSSIRAGSGKRSRKEKSKSRFGFFRGREILPFPIPNNPFPFPISTERKLKRLEVR